MKLTFRFVLLVSALLLAVAASAVAGSRSLTRLDSALSGVVSVDMERLLAITHTRRLFRSMVVLERDYMLSSSAKERDGMDKKLATSAHELLEQIDKYEKLMPDGDRAALRDIREVRSRWLELNKKVHGAARAGDAAVALALSSQHAKDPVSWEAVIGKLVKANEKRLQDQVANTHVVYNNAQRTLRLVSGGAALLALVLGTIIFLGIRRAVREVFELNTNLEGLVAQRTEALAQRERSLRLVLDSTGDGIIGVRKDGKLAGGASAAAERWFGPAKALESAAAYLYPQAGDARDNFEVALDQLFDDLLPWELLVAQMPSRMERDGRVLELEYRQVTDEDSDVRLLILVSDATARVQSERAELAAREQQSLVSKLLADKQGFSIFVADAERLIQSLGVESNESRAKQDLHTIKGNVGIYGLSSLASACHAIESRLAEEGGLPTADEVADLSAQFRGKLQGIEHFLVGMDKDVIEVESEEHDELVKSLRARKDYREILSMVELWTWPRTAELLTRLRGQIEHVAKRLGKEVHVSIEDNDLRLPASYLEQFWPTLGHVVRNAVDHGIEGAEARVDRGKPAAGSITLRTRLENGHLRIEVSDDGAGIDIEAVRRAAEGKGLSAGGDLVDLVFTEGLSTREQVTDISGRGVGLAATREACEGAGGRISVTTTTGKGTTFAFEFRRPIVKAVSLDSAAGRRWTFPPENDGSQTLPKAARSA